MRSVVDRENLVRKIQFPRLAIPISVVLLAPFNLGLNLIVVMIFAVIAGVRPMLSWLELPLIVPMLTVLATGVAMLLSALFVRFRDISADLGSVQPDPVLLLAGDPPGGNRAQGTLSHGSLDHVLYHVYTLNPLVTIFQQFRHAMINHATLSAGQVMGSWPALLEPMALVAADLRARLLVLQPRGAAHRRGPVEDRCLMTGHAAWIDCPEVTSYSHEGLIGEHWRHSLTAHPGP